MFNGTAEAVPLQERSVSKTYRVANPLKPTEGLNGATDRR
jgi:hypothetical protein